MTNDTFSVDDLPLTEPGECVLTACYFVDDPDGTWGHKNDLYLADSKPTCTYGQSICLEISIIITT